MTDAREAELLTTIKTLNERLARMDALEKENALLRQKLDLLIRKLFGAQSERLDPAQLLLLLQSCEEPPGAERSETTAEGSPKGGAAATSKMPEPVAAEAPRRSMAPSNPPGERAPRIPAHLPVIKEVIVPAAVQAAPQDWRQIGQEVSDRLDYEPGRFLCRRTIRPNMCSVTPRMRCLSSPRCRSRSWSAAW